MVKSPIRDLEEIWSERLFKRFKIKKDDFTLNPKIGNFDYECILHLANREYLLTIINEIFTERKKRVKKK